MSRATALDHYRLLGRSGLRVSPLSLGTMTFGSDWGWGADASGARQIFDAYIDRGGNFIDTSVNYTDGASERMLGAFAKDKRDRLVLATKYTLSRDTTNVNAGGNHRYNLVRSVETSLRQLDTDRIDLLYLHGWDFTTSPQEVMRALDDLVRAGKVLYLGISNTPAWRIAQMQTLADLKDWSPLVALQIEYSLVERSVEHELLPMAEALGLGVLPWSPLGGGVLTGKYSAADLGDAADDSVTGTRKSVIASVGHLTQRSLDIADVVREIAGELGATSAQVALAWTLLHPAVVSPLIGARTVEQAQDNFGALELSFSAEQVERLDQVSAVAPIFPERFIKGPMIKQLIFGAHGVEARTAGRL